MVTAVLEPLRAAPTLVPSVNTWFFMCGPLSVNLFLLGLAGNLYVFERHGMAVHRVLDMRRDELPPSHGVALFSALLFTVQLTLYALEWWRRGPAFGVEEMRMEMLLVAYSVVAAALLFCPWDILHRKSRYFVVRRLAKCLWPFQDFAMRLPPRATPFIEVFLADGLTSLSKFLQDSAVAWMLLSLSFTQELGDLRLSYVSKMKHSPLPYFAASMPYIIRATQCLISFKRTANANDRFLHLLNTLKYGSSLLVISVGAYPQIVDTTVSLHSLFLFCAVFNSMYSFLWDVIMDWGLGQPGLPLRVRLLRHPLLYEPHGLYYGVIAIDFFLRILWVTKWWHWAHIGVDFKMLSMVAEVLRRVLWNTIRVEWQCIKLDVLGSKKLSEDSMALEQGLEHIPLVHSVDEDDGSNDMERGGDADEDGRDADVSGGSDSGRDMNSEDELLLDTQQASAGSNHEHQVESAGASLEERRREGVSVSTSTMNTAHLRKPQYSSGNEDEVFGRPGDTHS